MFVPVQHRHHYRNQVKRKPNSAARTYKRKVRNHFAEQTVTNDGLWVCAQCFKPCTFVAGEQLYCESCQGVIMEPQNECPKGIFSAI